MFFDIDTVQAELAGFYRDADVALITPLRDGMNLVAKEGLPDNIVDIKYYLWILFF